MKSQRNAVKCCMHHYNKWLKSNVPSFIWNITWLFIESLAFANIAILKFYFHSDLTSLIIVLAHKLHNPCWKKYWKFRSQFIILFRHVAIVFILHTDLKASMFPFDLLHWKPFLWHGQHSRRGSTILSRMYNEYLSGEESVQNTKL